jgi:hypothetical protein
MGQNPDWRLQAFSNLAEDWPSPWDGQQAKAGARLTVVTIAKTKAGKELTLPLPNATALMLSASQRAFREAGTLRVKARIDTASGPQVQFKQDAQAFEYLERIMESVLTAHAGLEAFANDHIPDDYAYACHRKSNVILEQLDKAAIQRHVSLCEKLSVVLPEVLGTHSPKGRKAWEDYRRLKKLRDRITHMKSEDRKSSLSDVDTVWHALVVADPPFLQALAMIRHFAPHLREPAGWIDRCPIT